MAAITQVGVVAILLFAKLLWTIIVYEMNEYFILCFVK